MADHYAKTLELLDELADLRSELETQHRTVGGKPARIYDDIRHVTQLAKIHATLAQCQRLEELGNFGALAR